MTKVKTDKCIKCKKRLTTSFIARIEQAKYYTFCQICSDILDSMPNIRVREFIQPDFMAGRIDKDIMAAKKRRVEGKSPWIMKDEPGDPKVIAEFKKKYPNERYSPIKATEFKIAEYLHKFLKLDN